MGWKMKNFNILRVHGKMWVLGGFHKKPIYWGDCRKKGGRVWTVCRFKGGGAWQERGGWCFWGGWLIPQCNYGDIMMSISTCDMVHFSIYLLNHNSLTHQTWSVDRCKQGQYFSEIFWVIQKIRAKFQALLNLATCFNLNQLCQVSSVTFFERMNKGELKMVNINS